MHFEQGRPLNLGRQDQESLGKESAYRTNQAVQGEKTYKKKRGQRDEETKKETKSLQLNQVRPVLSNQEHQEHQEMEQKDQEPTCKIASRNL